MNHNKVVCGQFSNISITDTLTGVTRQLSSTPNKITDKALVHFFEQDNKYHNFHQCFISKDELSDELEVWGTNSDKFIESNISLSPHSSIETIDDGSTFAFRAKKTFKFSKGIEGEFKTIALGFKQRDEHTVSSVPVDNLFIQSIASIESETGTSLVLKPTDVLSVTHVLTVNLPKYASNTVIPQVRVDGKLQAYDIQIEPLQDRFDSSMMSEGESITRMYRNTPNQLGYADESLLSLINHASLLQGVQEHSGDWTITEQQLDSDGNKQPVIKSTINLSETLGNLTIDRMVITGPQSWYLVSISPALTKSRLESLSLSFYFSWG